MSDKVRPVVGEGVFASGEVEVHDEVPSDLASTARRYHDAGKPLVVHLHPPMPDGAERDGWEIGAITAALHAGADEVRGVDARRVARVRLVVENVR